MKLQEVKQMRNWTAVVIIVGLVLPSLAQAAQGPNVANTKSPVVLSQGAAIARALDQEKAVPRGDKDAVELIGTVTEGYSITDPCSGTPIIVVWVASKAAPLSPVGGGCAGPSFAPCASLRVGQRVRLQGILLTLPDPTTPGFNACDPNTWFLPPVPLQTFLVTKVLK